MKTLFKLFWLLALAAIFVACGEDDDGDNPTQSFVSTMQNTTSKVEGEETESTADPITGDSEIVFKGFVVNAFEVIVDGVEYMDMEDFFTQELDRLPEKAAEAGYTGDFEVRFDAEIGFSDLWQNMTVYIAPINNRGYQGEGSVEKGGEFNVSLPADAADESYKIRANKRISVVIYQDGASTSLCYYFSAIDKSVLLSESEKPIILSEFTTKLTKYECPGAESSGLDIPQVDPADQPFEFGQIAPSMTKAEVLGALGSENLYIESTSKWCYHSPDLKASPVCAINFSNTCQCSVTFDGEGLLLEQYNINPDLLDIAQW